MATKKWALPVVACISLGALGLIAYQAYQVLNPVDHAAGAVPPIHQNSSAAANAPPVVPKETFLNGHTDGVRALAFSPDGSILASGSGDRTIILWDMATKEAIRTLKGHASPVLSLAFSSDGKRLLSGALDHSILVWDMEKYEVEEIHEQRCPVYRLAFLPDKRHFVSACGPGLRVWEFGKSETIHLHTTDRDISALAVGHNGEVFTGDKAGNLIVWDPLASSILYHHRRPTSDRPWNRTPAQPNRITGIFIRQDKKVLVSDLSGTWLWDRQTDKLSLIGKAPTTVTGVLPDQRYYTAFSATSWVVREMEPAGIHGSCPVPNARVSVPSPDGVYVAASGGGEVSEDGTWIPAGPTPIVLASVALTKIWIEQQKERIKANPTDPELIDPHAIQVDTPAPFPWE